jgi:hypothetical protein
MMVAMPNSDGRARVEIPKESAVPGCVSERFPLLAFPSLPRDRQAPRMDQIPFTLSLLAAIPQKYFVMECRLLSLRSERTPLGFSEIVCGPFCFLLRYCFS